MKKTHLVTFFVLLYNLAYSSTIEQDLQSQQDQIDSLAIAILNKQIVKIDSNDYTYFKKSARLYIKILNNKFSFKELNEFSIRNNHLIEGKLDNIEKLSALDHNLEIPIKEIDRNYIEWLSLKSMLYLNANKLITADSINNVLVNYLNDKPKDNLVIQKGTGLSLIPQCVFAVIKNDFESGFEKCKKVIDIAKNLKDTNLQIMAQYYMSEFYTITNDLDGFLKMVEYNYKLDSTRRKRSRYQAAVIRQWLDALIYIGNDTAKIEMLFKTLKHIPFQEFILLELQLRYLAKLTLDAPYMQRFMKKYNASNVAQMINNLDSVTQSNLTQNNYIHFLESASKVLYVHGFHKEALECLSKANRNIESLYGEKLSNDLAQIESDKIRQVKNAEIEVEKGKKRTATITSIAISTLLIVILISFFYQRKQSIKLASKNKEIEKQKTTIEQADKEKSLLIKEIHHRVKNNFQVVSSLIELQSRNIEDNKARELAEEGQNRIKSMALIHQRLYQNEDLLIQFDEYTHALVNEVSAMYDKEIETDIDAENFAFDIDTAIPLGLILNELITNAFKYGFEKSHKKLTVKFEKLETEYKMTVQDNGKGFKDDINFNTVKSLGLRLVKRLSQQLKGRAEINFTKGAAFEIYFKDTHMRNHM
ncbi:MAG: sensor histidine kinase [Bacteroidia bacterium]